MAAKKEAEVPVYGADGKFDGRRKLSIVLSLARRRRVVLVHSRHGRIVRAMEIDRNTIKQPHRGIKTTIQDQLPTGHRVWRHKGAVAA